MTSLAETNVYARSLVWRTLRDAADEDYMFARQAALMRSPHQFAWSAQQCVEKYCKGILIINDKSADELGHSLTVAFKNVREISGNLIPLIWAPPNEFPNNIATFSKDFEPFDDFVSRLNDTGDTDHRYRHYNLSISWYDLHKLDELVFQLRRLMFPLNMQYANTNQTYRDILSDNPNFAPNHDLFGSNKPSSKGYQLRIDAFTKMNFSFFPERALDDGALSNGFEQRGSQLGGTVRYREDGEQALDWFCKRIRIRKRDIDEIRKLIGKAKKRPS